MTHFQIEEIISSIDAAVTHPLVTPNFGDNWMKHAFDNISKEELITIAWKQGRRAILLERALRRQLGQNHFNPHPLKPVSNE